MKVLRDIWILHECGTVMFSRVFDKTIDDQLFGALLSALNSFAEELSDGGLSNFEIKNKKFTILKHNGLLFVVNSSTKVKDKKVMRELKKISDVFFRLYSNEIAKSWDNDVSQFVNFKDEIEKSLEDPVKQFWTGF